MSETASTSSRFTADAPLPYTRFPKWNLFIFKMMHTYLQNQLNPPKIVIYVQWFIYSMYLLMHPLKSFYIPGIYLGETIKKLGYYFDPSFHTKYLAQMIVFLAIGVVLIAIAYLTLVIMAIFSNTDKPVHRYIGKFHRVFTYFLMSSVSLSVIIWLGKPTACYCQPSTVNMVFCGSSSQLQLMIVSAIFIVIFLVLIGFYHFFVFNTKLSDDSYLRSYSGRSMAIVMVITTLWVFASPVPILRSETLNSTLHVVISFVLVLIILVFPPFYLAEMNAIITATFLTSMWGGICAFTLPAFARFSVTHGSPVLPNVILHIVVYGGSLLIWTLSILFIPSFFRRRWLVKVDSQKFECSKNTPDHLHRHLPKREVIGYTFRIGTTTFIRRFDGYSYPSNITPQVLSYQNGQENSMLHPHSDNAQHRLSPQPSQITNALSDKPQFLESPQNTFFMPLSPAPSIMLVPSAAPVGPVSPAPSIMPISPAGSIVSTISQVQTPLLSVNIPAPIRPAPSQAVQAKLQPPVDRKNVPPVTRILNDSNLTEAVRKVAKSIRRPGELQQLFSFLQVEDIARDPLTVRLVDLVFRQLISKERFAAVANVRITYSLFLAHHMNSQYRMAAQIQKACDFLPTMTDRWICYVKTKEMEKKVPSVNALDKITNLAKFRQTKRQKGRAAAEQMELVVTDDDGFRAFTSPSNEGEDSTSTNKINTLKIQLAQAQRLFLIAQGHLNMLWMHLGRRNVDCERVQENAIKALAAEKEATRIYLQQMKEHPDNPNVYRPFALLLRDQSNDDESATLLLQEADRIEGDNEMLFTLSTWDEDENTQDEETKDSNSHTQESIQHNHQFEQKKKESKTRNQIELLINKLETNAKITSHSHQLIVSLVVSALLVVFFLTIASYITTFNDFKSFSVESGIIRYSLFISTASEDVAFFISAIHLLSASIDDFDNPSPGIPELYVGMLERELVTAKECYNEYNGFVQQFYPDVDSTWFNTPGVPYSVTSKMANSKVVERAEEILTVRQLLYRCIEMSQPFVDNIEQVFTDRNNFEIALVELHQNFHLQLLEEVKDFASLTMDSVSQLSVVGLIVQMVFLFFASVVLLCFATLPICLKIRSVNRLGKEQLRVLCVIPAKDALQEQIRLERKAESNDGNSYFTDSETETENKKDNDNDDAQVDPEGDEKEQDEREEDVDEKLKKAKNVVPKLITVSLVVGTVLVMLVSYTVFIMALIALVSLPEMSRLIIFSGYRRPYFNMLLSFDVMRLQPTFFPLADPSNESLIFKTDRYTSAILDNTSFIHDPAQLDEVILKCVEFLKNLSARFLYGSRDDTLTGDEFYDKLSSSGSRGRFVSVDDINTRTDTCFHANRTICEQEGRLGDFTGEFNGLIEVISIVLQKSVALVHDDDNSTKFEDQDMTLLINLTRHDVQSSLTQIGRFLQEELTALSTMYQTVLLVIIIAASVSEIIIAFVFFVPLPRKLRTIEFNAGRMSSLATVLEKEKVEWTEELEVDIVRMDVMKKLLFANMKDLLESVERRKKAKDIDPIIDQILLITITIFNDEEDMMDTHDCPESMKKEHARQHASLFKKLVEFINSHRKKRFTVDETREFCTSWIQNHITGDDYDLALFLQQTALPMFLSEMPDINSTAVPRSVLRYYKRSSVGMEERTRFRSLIDRLGMDWDDNDV
ncbi:putative hemerythrin [Blattamonas nauphoetae]|uniref:Hemerythrin n=1 Tax=Blattamonas nauphoetae TaxID=2049346 RepID=A0ABQ9XKE0_9EUKA|nr:putative hemerythrin [Blattamonas nauphoetae]